MKFALVDNISTEAAPGLKALCPCCRAPVIAKCGDIKIWHWAHLNADCDPWHEPETEWHRAWKNAFPKECQEIAVQNHRADVIYRNHVFEFQHSSISQQEIYEREMFWLNQFDQMFWIIDASEFANNFDLRVKKNFGYWKIVSFRWKYPRKTWWDINANLAIDLGDNILEIKKLYSNTPCGGWGNLYQKKYYHERLDQLINYNESIQNRDQIFRASTNLNID